MSGGIAYVYDPEGRLGAHCNTASVELELIEPGADPDANLDDLLRFDAERLRPLVERHAAATGSARAKALLDDWHAALWPFLTFMPLEYPRASGELPAA